MEFFSDTPATPVKDSKRLSLVPQSPDVPSQSGDDGGSHNGDTIIEDEVHEDGVVEKYPLLYHSLYNNCIDY